MVNIFKNSVPTRSMTAGPKVARRCLFAHPSGKKPEVSHQLLLSLSFTNYYCKGLFLCKREDTPRGDMKGGPGLILQGQDSCLMVGYLERPPGYNWGAGGGGGNSGFSSCGKQNTLGLLVPVLTHLKLVQEKFKRNCTDLHPLAASFFPAMYTKPDKWPRALIRVFIVIFTNGP